MKKTNTIYIKQLMINYYENIMFVYMYYLKTYTDIFNGLIIFCSYKILIIVIYCR